jgi:hypothetical protein
MSAAVAIGGLLIGGAAGFAIGQQSADSGSRIEGSTSAGVSHDDHDSDGGAPGGGFGGPAPGQPRTGDSDQAPFDGQVPPGAAGSAGTGSFS